MNIYGNLGFIEGGQGGALPFDVDAFDKFTPWGYGGLPKLTLDMSMKDKGGEAEFQPWVYHNEPYSDPLPDYEDEYGDEETGAEPFGGGGDDGSGGGGDEGGDDGGGEGGSSDSSGGDGSGAGGEDGSGEGSGGPGDGSEGGEMQAPDDADCDQ